MYSRALLVMGEQEGLRFAEQNGLAALLLVQNKSGGIQEAATRGFERLTQVSTLAAIDAADEERWAFRPPVPQR